MNFGQRLKKLRETKQITQQELAKRLGYVSNSYVAEVEGGKYVPSEDKLRKIAKALKVPFKEMKGLLAEARIEELGIRKPELVELFRDIPRLSEKDKEKIIKVYLSIKKKLK